MNPQRLATKKLKPGFFYVQEHVEIGGRMYQAVGNAKLLQAARMEPVHVRSIWVRAECLEMNRMAEDICRI